MLDHAVAIHGGAGSLARVDAAARGAMRRALTEALGSADRVLASGGPALDAVVAAVCVLEAAECFNAGRGSVLRADGTARMDASIACGATGRAGGVVGVRRVRHPVQLARAVMQRGEAVLLLGDRADALALDLGLAREDEAYFVTEARRRQWAHARARGRVQLDHDGQTVGAVALDAQGHLAAATSTGGLTNADPGRIGDSPIVGAGSWARDDSCAVSATGTGEVFLRTCFAHDVHARMRWAGQDLGVAVARALGEVTALGGAGGCVAVNRQGDVVLPFTTASMPRAFRDRRGNRVVRIAPDTAPDTAAHTAPDDLPD